MQGLQDGRIHPSFDVAKMQQFFITLSTMKIVMTERLFSLMQAQNTVDMLVILPVHGRFQGSLQRLNKKYTALY